ncbi:MAG TPA: glutathione S-transferase [Steroidobacteraceae bacterium]|nr:glutathione S-transferase [Steroidobacteraceae bacterium]
MLQVHHLNNSRSQRVLWLLEELGCPYELIPYQRDPKTLLAPESLRRVHPLGKSPVITDGAHTIAESGAIIEYLLESYGEGRLRPAAGSEARLRYTYWLHYAEGSAMPPLLLKLIFQYLPRGPVPALLRPLVRAIAAGAQKSYIDPQLALHMRYWEAELSREAWFAGADFSAADIQMSFPVEAAAARSGLPLGQKVRGFLERIHARAPYQRALSVAGGFRLPG